MKKTNTREEITEIVQDLTCYDYLRMDGKSHEFLEKKDRYEFYFCLFVIWWILWHLI